MTRMAECCPEKKHHCRGLCRVCYFRARRAGSIGDKAGCHTSRPVEARGLCLSCYNKQQYKVQPLNKIKATCHPARPHKAKGMCESCYSASRQKAGIVSSQKARCHPDDPHRASGLCDSCYQHSRQSLKRYGLSRAQYVDLLHLQEGLCAICKTSPGKRRLSIDHCHETGAVRGLLCVQCNTALERLESISNWADKAKEYLK